MVVPGDGRKSRDRDLAWTVHDGHEGTSRGREVGNILTAIVGRKTRYARLVCSCGVRASLDER